ncbi:3-oxoacyl-ACP synthase III family protein [Thermotalea metallivorans]|uniref:3-oxoacyl-[acyl-carrier-protein] synthase 3 n=1 Tax=Thermotalea metallivorans TaxID=520762 RepID=A0A140L7A7_9FIRM|nr:beta-ketoacyl-ACP synthase III [Thermotalea metallivorans]KXG76432.1 3-oxoacyl-[acyl-carrier-protein] synthase 3 [Thermotalea metallivorans]
MMIMTGKKVIISGTGSYVPDQVVTNDELEKCAPTNKAWIESVLGIKERRRMARGECTSDMAAKAAVKALEMAEMKAEDIDLIIVGTITPDRMVPSLATIVQRKIAAPKAAAFDLNAACAGFVFSLICAQQFLKNDYFQNALVIGADAMSVMTDYKDRTCAYYGDGAGAVVLKNAKSQNGILSTYFASDGQSKDMVTTFGGNAEYPPSYEVLDRRWHYLRMAGKEVGITASEVIPHAIRRAMEEAAITVDDIAYLVPHQPNLSLLKKCASVLNIPEEKVVITLDRYANASSANIPLALDKINREGKLKEGDKIVMATIGAGWTWGSAVIQWGQ